VVASALRYRTAAPMVDSLLREVGLGTGGDLAQMLNGAATLGHAGGDAPQLPDAGKTGRESSAS
jgi:hypothetical protein